MLPIPMGLEWTDKWLMKVSELTGKPIPESLEKTRPAGGHDHGLPPWLHGKHLRSGATRTLSWA